MANRNSICSPAPVPQHGGIHQVDENKVVITSSGNRVTFLCICRRLRTRARDAPTVKRTRPLRRRLAARTLCKEPYADVSTEDMMDIISPALAANQLAPAECFASAFDAQEQLQQRSSRLDIWHFRTALYWNSMNSEAQGCGLSPPNEPTDRDSYLDPLFSAPKRTLPSSSFAKTRDNPASLCSNQKNQPVYSCQAAWSYQRGPIPQHRALLLGTSASSAENNHSWVGWDTSANQSAADDMTSTQTPPPPSGTATLNQEAEVKVETAPV